MANNKVVFGQEVLIDLTQDTVTPYALEEGYTAHAPSGEKIVGVMKPNKPVEVETNAEMTAISTGATEKDLGKVYLFVGEDDGVFEKDALYILVKKGTGYGFQRYAIGGSGEESTPLQEKSVEVTENGTKEILPDEGYGLSKVIITTNVAGREDLDAELNEQEALIAELKEKLANGGGSQECDCVIDVTELPTGYKDVDVYIRLDASTYLTFLQLFQSEGLNPDITYYVVDELPTEGKVTNFAVVEALTEAHVYIANNIPYVYGDLGDGTNRWQTVSGMLTLTLETPFTDKGFTSDITAETEKGVYVTYKEGEKPVEGAVYRVTTEGSAEIYLLLDGVPYTLTELYAELGASATITVYLVDVLPSIMEKSYQSGTEVYQATYVVRETGVAYVSKDGTSENATTVGSGLGSGIVDRGWSEDITGETLNGVYAVGSKGGITYHIHSNGAWTEYIDGEPLRNEIEKLENSVAEKTASANFTDCMVFMGNFTIQEIKDTQIDAITFPKYDDYCKITLGIHAFRDTKNLKSIVLPNCVVLIEGEAFRGSGIASITIPNSVTSIGSYAFGSCADLTSITFTGTKEQWEAITKGYSWDDGTPDYIITCTDGTIAKDGTET